MECWDHTVPFLMVAGLILGSSGAISLFVVFYRLRLVALLIECWGLKTNAGFVVGFILWVSGTVVLSVGFACMHGTLVGVDDCYIGGHNLTPLGILMFSIGLVFMCLACRWQVKLLS